jgi:predicted dienelactone hydrolase
MANFKVGFQEGLIHDQGRRSWADDGPRPIRWSAWYPANGSAIERTLTTPPDDPLFVIGTVARDATINEHYERFSVVILSHGTGGTATSLGWLAQRLAAVGYIVLGVDHHGNTASEAYKAEGFLCWWERPRDLTVALDILADSGPFAGRLDLADATCVGFSLGGYTALSVMGAITDMARFQEWAGTSASGKGPREFPDLADRLEPLLRESAIFRASWERQSVSNLDQRIRTAVALAPAPTVRAFTPDSLAAINAPITIMVGEADQEAPAGPCSIWLSERLPNSQLHFLGRNVGHYSLLSLGTEEGRRLEPEICIDAPGVDRSAIHELATEIALRAISEVRSEAAQGPLSS